MGSNTLGATHKYLNIICLDKRMESMMDGELSNVNWGEGGGTVVS